jgi:prepilin-type N-terminal cleavage/methylation domain-containing protein
VPVPGRCLLRILATIWVIRVTALMICNICCKMRRGFTLIELAIVLVVMGVVAGLAAPRIAGYADRLAVRRAKDETTAFYNRVRIAAVYRAVRVRVVFTGDSLLAISEGAIDSIVTKLPGPARYGVALNTSRGELRLYPNGLGLGAANTKLVFRKGVAADSLTISRLGRIRQWP